MEQGIGNLVPHSWIVPSIARLESSVVTRDERRTGFGGAGAGAGRERELGETPAAVPYVNRRANHKSFLEIHSEIREFQTQPVPHGGGMPAAFLRMMSSPWPLPRLFVRLIRAVSRRDPTRLVTAAGTVGVTALGMAGRGGGWGVAPAGHSLLLIVGGITRKPAVIDQRVEPRDLLNLTVAFDHDVVDGAPAARFVKRLVALESGYGLEEARRGRAAAANPDNQ